MTSDLIDAAVREVHELHAFFEAWLSGQGPAGASDFERLPSVLAPEFQIISPAGETMTRDTLIEGLRGAHGARGDQFRLWVDQVEGRLVHQDCVLVTYQEWQSTEALERGRVSSALFTQRAAKLLWQHVHETWLPEGSF